MSVCPIGSQPITGVFLILVLVFLTGFGLMTSTTRREPAVTDNRDAVAHVAMYALLGKALKDQENQGRSYLVDSMEVGDAVVGRANGLPVGRAVKSVRTDAKVVDDKALLKWVKSNHPDEVETVEQVRPAFLAQLKKAGELSDGETLSSSWSRATRT